jgi:dihydroxyacetone kinase
MYVGNFMTALNMTGLSVTLCHVDQLRLARLDAPVVGLYTLHPVYP